MRDIYKVLHEHQLVLAEIVRKTEAIKLVITLLETPEPAPAPEPAPETPPQSTQTAGEGIQGKVRWP